MIKAILFDVDGVLLDSMHANGAWYRTVLAHFGYAGPSDADMPTIHHLLAVDVFRRYIPGVTEDQLSAMMAYGDHIDSDPALLRMPHGAQAVVQELADQYPLGIVTHRTLSHLQELFHFYNKDWFRAHVVAEDTTKHKPDPEPLFLAAKRLHVPAEHCVYIGDMPSDVEAGHAAGMKVIVYSQNNVSDSDASTDTFSEIPNVLKTFRAVP